jgi:hypothetical protein
MSASPSLSNGLADGLESFYLGRDLSTSVDWAEGNLEDIVGGFNIG